MMIIDSHAHLGYDYVFDEESTEESIISHYDKYGVDGAIIQPFICRPYLDETRAIHDRIAIFCNTYPKRFYGMASINPHFYPEDYYEEANRCVKQLDFVALKLTPIAHATNPASIDGLHVFETAQDLGVPVMVHTGAGIPFSDPIQLIKVFELFPKLKIVLAHAGTDMFFSQALMIMQKYPNAYIEPSWLSILNTRKLLQEVGASRVMFSSDHTVNVPVELVKYRTLLQNEKDLEQVLSGTAIKVFNLKMEK